MPLPQLESLAQLTDFVQSGAEALERLRADGPFLVDVPTHDPLGGLRTTSLGSEAKTMAFNEELLRELRRSHGSEDVVVHRLAKEAILGRSSRCTIPLREEASVSKEHARIHDQNGWILEDLGATNGTFVGGARIHDPTPLTSPVLIQLGAQRFVFLDGADMVLWLTPVDTSEPIPVAQLRTHLESLGSRRFALRYTSPVLLVAFKGVHGASRSTFRPDIAVPLVGAQSLRVGRTRSAEITFKRDSVSKWHATLSPNETGWQLRDDGSSNGTFVNGTRLAPQDPTKLTAWDAVAFGPSTWALYLDAHGLVQWLAENH